MYVVLYNMCNKIVLLSCSLYVLRIVYQCNFGVVYNKRQLILSYMPDNLFSERWWTGRGDNRNLLELLNRLDHPGNWYRPIVGKFAITGHQRCIKPLKILSVCKDGGQDGGLCAVMRIIIIIIIINIFVDATYVDVLRANSWRGETRGHSSKASR